MDTIWLAVVSRLPIENCHKKQTQGGFPFPIRFDLLCHRRWEDLQTTEDRWVRFCGGCKQSVHYCDTIMEARSHVQAGHCIAVDLGVIRRDRDLEPRWMGRVRGDSWRAEEERLGPDPVSAERQRRKRDKGKG